MVSAVPSASADLNASPARRAAPLPPAALSPSLALWPLSRVSLLQPHWALHTAASDLVVSPPCGFGPRVPSERMARPSPGPFSARPLHSSHTEPLLLPASLLRAPGPLHLRVVSWTAPAQIPARLSLPWVVAEHYLLREGTTCLTLRPPSPCPTPPAACPVFSA